MKNINKRIPKKNKINKFTKILQQYKYNLNNGDILAGTIIYKEKSGFIVNIGTKIAGYLPHEEVTIKDLKTNKNNLLLINTTREFFLVTKNFENRQPILSIKRLEYIRAWKRIKQLYIEDILLELKIYYINKGGLITYIEGIQGFIPRSHIEINSKHPVKQILPQTYIYCKLLTLNEKKNQMILSNKKAVLTLCQHKFKLGELVYGKIILIKSYGLFLNIYGIKALLHVSEIGFTYIKNINVFFSLGKLIKVKIIHINIKQGKVSVSKRNIKS